MRRTTLRHWVLVTGLALAMLLGGHAARGEAGSDQAAAMIVYPYVTLDNTHGTNTLLQISNTSTEPVTVQCFWDAPGTADPFLVCSNSSAVDFQFTLTPRQPIGWLASSAANKQTLVASTAPPASRAESTRVISRTDSTTGGTVNGVA